MEGKKDMRQPPKTPPNRSATMITGPRTLYLAEISPAEITVMQLMTPEGILSSAVSFEVYPKPLMIVAWKLETAPLGILEVHVINAMSHV